jgi:hypothetical protein
MSNNTINFKKVTKEKSFLLLKSENIKQKIARKELNAKIDNAGEQEEEE